MLEFLPDEIKNIVSDELIDLCEVRLRAGTKLVAEYIGGRTKTFSYVVSEDDLDKIILRLTKHTIYAYSDSIKRGYITGDNGERVGICGTCVVEEGRVRIIKNVTSLCVRIPRQVVGFADELIKEYIRNGLFSTIVISPPGYGKTTFLRDVARGISLKLKKNVLISDEKRELYFKSFAFGDHCDFMLCANKIFAFTEGLRNMRPDVILCDELSFKEEAFAALSAALSGASVIVSAHARDIKDLTKKHELKDILEAEIFKKAVIIGENYSVKICDL
ncbi:MAG: hypothetical protein J6Y44_00695 [Clostridia bacterium]|nr:hypothetical protein [Clostridia bacterium]